MASDSFIASITAWLQREPAVASAVLFGSTAKLKADEAAGRVADVDLHVISPTPARLKQIDWARELPDHGFAFQVLRPATGGVVKLTVFFTAGQIDIVIVPLLSARLARLLSRTSLSRSLRPVAIALNEMATCLHSGYRFLKGERRWGAFYARVQHGFGGVRLDEAAVLEMAGVFLAEYLWVRQKLNRGELIAAQHVLHRSLSETNLRLYRELRLRRNLPLPSFGLGRRVEQLALPAEAERLGISARLDAAELGAATEHALRTLQFLMQELAPQWGLPAPWPTLMPKIVGPPPVTPAS